MVAALLPPKVHAATRPIVFPVLGPASYVNDFNAPRTGGIHGATDIMAGKMQALVAAVDGTITLVNYPQPSWGFSVFIEDSDGYSYNYIHMNNDTPGTGDNNGDPMFAYAPDMKVGNRVVKGQLLGYVGDSGFSNGVPHLHFEIYDPAGNPINPYDSLRQAQILCCPVMHPALKNELLPYGPNFSGGINIAMANFDDDTDSEIITGAGQGGGPHVRTFDDNNDYLTIGFLAYNPDMRSGIDVASGDVDGDGVDEIITAPGPGGGPHVKVFKLDGTLKVDFFAYDEPFRGGVHVSSGDVDGDGVDEIITGAGPGGGPHVRVFKGDGTPLSGFFAYNEDFRGGVDVASADVAGTPDAEIITGAGPGGGPHVRVLTASGEHVDAFFAYANDFRGGIRVSAGNVRDSTTKSEILTIPESRGGPQAKMFTSSGQPLVVKMFLESWWHGGYDIAAGESTSIGATGFNRRVSVRTAIE